jgi:predicted murein hydrolase (TIGR00659 family)
LTILIGAAWLVVTIVTYLAAKALYQRRKLILLSPLLISPLVLIGLLLWFNVPYSTYMIGGQWLAKLLGPATVAFAIPLHRHFDLLKKHAAEILASVAAGSLVAVVTGVEMAARLHLSADTVRSMAPRSVTTPIAMGVAGTVGGVPTLTAVFVIVTGLFGLVAGPLVIRSLRIRTPVARGALLGMGAHGCGTSKAFELGSIEGTVASLSMVVAGGLTIVLAPVLLSLL